MSLRMRMLSCMEMMGQTKTDQGCLQLQTTPIRGVSYANRLMEEGFQDLFCHHRAEAISPSSKCTSSPPPTTSSCLPSTSTQLTGEPLFHRHYAGSPKSSASICNALITAKPPSPRPGGNQKFVCVFCDIWTRWESVSDDFLCFLSVYSSINLISLLPLSEFQNSVT